MENNYVLLLLLKKQVNIPEFLNLVFKYEEKHLFTQYQLSWSVYSTYKLSEFEFNYLVNYLSLVMNYA